MDCMNQLIVHLERQACRLTPDHVTQKRVRFNCMNDLDDKETRNAEE